MYRSLAYVGILAIWGSAGTGMVYAQTDPDPATTEGVVVKNHISDQERDRLMREAMENARKELEAQKAKQAKDEERAAEKEKQKEESQRAAEAAQDKIDQQKKDAEEAAARQKAEDERLAKKLAEAEKASSSASANELKPLSTSEKTVDLDAVKKEEAPVKSAAADKKSDSSEKKTETSETRTASAEKKADTSDTKKVAASGKSSSKEKAEEKVVVKPVQTNEPGASLTVKASAQDNTMPGKVKDVDRDIHFDKADVARGDVENPENNGSDSLSISGQVVGMMRSTGQQPRILLREENGQMTQVLLESDAKVPAPASTVTIRGRRISGGDGRQVISATSVRIQSGSAMESEGSPRQSRSVVAGAPPMPMAGPAVPMMPPPFGIMPPPMPMIPGMMPPPPF